MDESAQFAHLSEYKDRVTQALLNKKVYVYTKIFER